MVGVKVVHPFTTAFLYTMFKLRIQSFLKFIWPSGKLFMTWLHCILVLRLIATFQEETAWGPAILTHFSWKGERFDSWSIKSYKWPALTSKLQLYVMTSWLQFFSVILLTVLKEIWTPLFRKQFKVEGFLNF